MFLISVRFRAARSRKDAGKPGVVFYKVYGRASFGDGPRLERNVNSDIRGLDEGVIREERERIVGQVRLLYCIVERRELAGAAFTADDVIGDFRMALAGDESMADVVAKSKTDSPMRRDIFKVSSGSDGDFKMESRQNRDSVAEYVTSLSRALKGERRISQSRNFLSLLSNLFSFTNGEDLFFSRIDGAFVRDYAEWLKQTGIVGSTQSFYLRTFRTILNKAQTDGLIEARAEWFADVDTKIYHSAGMADKDFSRELLLKIRDLSLTDDEQIAQVRDLFMFGYYCGGMELVDIVNLTADNLRDNVLKYRRRLKGKETSVVLGEQAQAILNHYKSDDSLYLFPMLDKPDGMTFSKVSHLVGYHVKTIGKLVGHPALTFGMNIAAYKSIVSGVNISEFLLSHG